MSIPIQCGKFGHTKTGKIIFSELKMCITNSVRNSELVGSIVLNYNYMYTDYGFRWHCNLLLISSAKRKYLASFLLLTNNYIMNTSVQVKNILIIK